MRKSDTRAPLWKRASQLFPDWLYPWFVAASVEFSAGFCLSYPEKPKIQGTKVWAACATRNLRTSAITRTVLLLIISFWISFFLKWWLQNIYQQLQVILRIYGNLILEPHCRQNTSIYNTNPCHHFFSTLLHRSTIPVGVFYAPISNVLLL